MRNSTSGMRRAGVWGALILACLPAIAGAQTAAPAEPPPPPDSEMPEYRTRSLPTDTFRPSEEVSEDFAVPFPADI